MKKKTKLSVILGGALSGLALISLLELINVDNKIISYISWAFTLVLGLYGLRAENRGRVTDMKVSYVYD
ncbi:putative integral membrane protein [Paenibacillus sp. DS2015]|uniref:hypothetical protein n=1 Tax=Paenibacillus sp. DS2015 TaxID=3373917 RepID=UPI003D21E481